MKTGIYEKLKILGPTASYDTCGPKESVDTKIPGIYYAKVNGGYCRLFKVLQSNVCIKNCKYCINQSCRDTKRVSLSSEEMALAFMEVYRKKMVEGLFLSSGIVGNPTYAMGKILDTATILREKYHYKGYIHLKVMPGVTDSMLEETVRLANRVSLNFEAPNEKRLKEISPDKNFKNEVFDTSLRLNQVRQKFNLETRRNVSQTTQFVVGATEENDREIIDSIADFYQRFKLTRVFYSSFRPVLGTALEQKKASSEIREHRLYQTDWLLRFYGFEENDIPLSKEGSLVLEKDPKLLWAENHGDKFPVEINNADYRKLIKIPGIGPIQAQKIIEKQKRYGLFYDHRQIEKMGVSLKRAGKFITVGGKYRKQLELF